MAIVRMFQAHIVLGIIGIVGALVGTVVILALV
jgi:hypothetical protein